jgi:cysteinyl-tRNA synthetase
MVYPTNHEFSLEQFGDIHLPNENDGLPELVWKQVLQVDLQNDQGLPPASESGTPNPEVMELVVERQSARQDKEWHKADRLRGQIAELGWQVIDTPDGPRIEKITLKEKK